MISNLDARRKALVDLIKLRVPTSDAVDALGRFPWDSEEDLVILGRQDLVAVLLRYLHGAISANDFEIWANAVEGREDIGIEAGHQDEINSFLFDAANPAISVPLTRARATEWLTALGYREDIDGD